MSKKEFILAFCIIILANSMRLAPHMANFTPIFAIALFANDLFRKPIVAIGVTFLSTFLANFVLGHTPSAFLTTSYAVLLSLPFFHSKLSSEPFKKAFIASFSFFCVSNFWVWQASGMYPLTLEGMLTCYTLALPFSGQTIASTLIYSGLIHLGLKRVREAATL